jgi:DNA-binding GntR family transcriptional regulator
MSVAESDGEKLLQHPPLRERVRDRLERLIVDGVYQPGEHLVETDLAQRLGVSRGPIREALYLLQLQGWVDLRPRQGAFVHQPSYEEVDQFFQVRALLEGETASLAAGKVSAEEVAGLREQIKAARVAIAKKDEGALIRANAEFHGSIHRLAGNPVLLELVSLLDKRLRWYFSPVSLERASSAWDEHELLLDALENGDRRRAVSLTRTHNNLTREAYVRHRKLVDRPASEAGCPAPQVGR